MIVNLFEGELAHNLQNKLKNYIRARIELYRMSQDFLLWQRREDFSDQQEDKLQQLKNELWDATIAACPTTSYRPACSYMEPSRRRASVTVSVSGSAPLSTNEDAVDEEQNHCADDGANEARGFAGRVPPNGLAKVGRDECAYNAQDGRQNEALRLSLVSRHN
jgi:hypothetical protein